MKFDVPLMGIGLELVGRCNASCDFCSWGHNKDVVHTNMFTGEKINRSTSKMSYELIDSIFDKHDIKGLIFTGLSEPLLAPDRLLYVADKAEKMGFGFSLFTNGNLFKEEYARKLLENKMLQSVHFSLNAVTDDVRRKVMGIPLSPAEDNLKMFLEVRRELGREVDTHVGCVFMITPDNRHEENAFKSKWRQVFSSEKNCNEPGLFFTTNWNGEIPAPWLKTSGSKWCPQWDMNSPTISVDGYMYMCCYTSKCVLGHCMNQEDVKNWLDRKNFFNIKDGDPLSIPKELCGMCNGTKDCWM